MGHYSCPHCSWPEERWTFCALWLNMLMESALALLCRARTFEFVYWYSDPDKTVMFMCVWWGVAARGICLYLVSLLQFCSISARSWFSVILRHVQMLTTECLIAVLIMAAWCAATVKHREFRKSILLSICKMRNTLALCVDGSLYLYQVCKHRTHLSVAVVRLVWFANAPWGLQSDRLGVYYSPSWSPSVVGQCPYGTDARETL